MIINQRLRIILYIFAACLIIFVLVKRDNETGEKTIHKTQNKPIPVKKPLPAHKAPLVDDPLKNLRNSTEKIRKAIKRALKQRPDFQLTEEQKSQISAKIALNEARVGFLVT